MGFSPHPFLSLWCPELSGTIRAIHVSLLLRSHVVSIPEVPCEFCLSQLIFRRGLCNLCCRGGPRLEASFGWTQHGASFTEPIFQMSTPIRRSHLSFLYARFFRLALLSFVMKVILMHKAFQIPSGTPRKKLMKYINKISDHRQP